MTSIIKGRVVFYVIFQVFSCFIFSKPFSTIFSVFAKYTQLLIDRLLDGR